MGHSVALVYALEFASGKFYVGLTELMLKQRWQLHRHAAQRTKSKQLVHEAWREFGNPFVTVLFEGDLLSADRAEVDAIAELNCRIPFGYNVAFGGRISPVTAPETKAKLSLVGKGRKASAETRARIAAALFGKPKSEAQRQAMRGRLPVAWTDDRKRSFSAYRTGKKNSAKTIKKMENAALARWAKQRKEFLSWVFTSS